MGKHSGEQGEESAAVVPPVLKPPPPPVRGAAHAPSIPRPGTAKHARSAASPARARSAPPPVTTPVVPPTLSPPPAPVERAPKPAATAPPAAKPTENTALARIRERNAQRLQAETTTKSADLHVPHARRMKVLAAAVLGTALAWAFLVAQAIGFGRTAKDGEGSAWIFLFLATLGATACMLLGIILANKLRLLLKGEEPVKAAGTPGGRRAAR